MKVIVAGSRDFADKAFCFACLDRLHAKHPITVIISGTARGPDTYGEEWAKKNNTEVIRMPADWDQFGKAAGYIRNAEMAEIGECLVAFWDGISRGTMHMIDIARKKGLKVWVPSGTTARG